MVHVASVPLGAHHEQMRGRSKTRRNEHLPTPLSLTRACSTVRATAPTLSLTTSTMALRESIRPAVMLATTPTSTKLVAVAWLLKAVTRSDAVSARSAAARCDGIGAGAVPMDVARATLRSA